MELEAAKKRLDSLIAKSRVDLYKPIQIAEVLHKSRLDPTVDAGKLETYRTQSKHWRDEVTLKLTGKRSTSSSRFQDNVWESNAMPPEILALLCQPMIATFADRAKNIALRTIVAFLLALTVILSLLLFVTPSIVLPTALLYILLVCFHSTQMPLITSLSLEHINNGIPLNFSLARGLGSFAFAILSFFMGFLVDDFGGGIIMLINISIGIVGIILVLNVRKANYQTVASSSNRASSILEFAMKNKRFMAVIVSVALLFFSHVLINTYTIQIIKNVGGTNADMGVATALAGFLEFPAMALFPLIFRRLRNAGTIMKLSDVFVVVKTLVTLLTPNVFWFNVAQCFQFFAFAMFVPSSVYYVSEVIDEVDKVKGQAYMGMAMGISGMIGNFTGGFMLDSSGGVSFMLTVGLIVSIIGLVMLVAIDGFRARPLKIFAAEGEG